MDSSFLFPIFIFLAAACVAVPVASRFKLGSVLGYLAAGVLIGPFGVGLIGNAEQIMRFAEFGVVMMLFLIGLELDPDTLWKLRRLILGLGSLQVGVTSLALAAVGILLGYDWRASLAAGMALSLSSTALVLQMFEERELTRTAAGEASLAVLLFQDVAVIPILILLPLLALSGGEATAGHAPGLLAGLPAWVQAIAVAATVALVVIAGRHASRHVFRVIAKTNLRELFTALSLAMVIGITLLMQLVGMSPAFGAFVAGVVLANSEYKHTLETDIQPFKGLLLGLFFISVGMGADLALLAETPGRVFGAAAALMLVKAAILLPLGRLHGLAGPQSTLLALALAQGGEFAFVLFQYAFGLHILPAGDAAFLTLAVALSMAATPLIMMLNDVYLVPMFMSRLPDPQFDSVPADRHSPVIIAGYGRFGQVVGRFLRAQGVEPTILEKDPDQIELLRKFGSRGYFGDASRPELLRNAGAAQAAVLVIAVDDADKCLEIARMAKEEFPALKIMARARNRRHAYELYKIGADYFRRECFDSSLVMAQEVMKALGRPAADMEYRARQFMHHDEETLVKSFAFFDREPELISFSRQATGELERILQSDIEQGATTPAAAAAAHK